MPSDSLRPTRENTDVVGARIGAQLIDLVLLFVQIVAVAFGFALLVRPETEGQLRVLVFVGLLTTPLYGGLLEAYWNGQTVGKFLLGIRVVDRAGEDPTLGQALIRNLPAALAPGWLAYLVAIAAMASSDRRQRVFDSAAGTYVVDARPAPGPGTTGSPGRTR